MALVLTRTGSLLPTLVDDFFDTDFLTPGLLDFDGGLTGSRMKRRMIPSVNIIENLNEFQIELATPGLEKEDFKVDVNNGVLTISAEKEEEENEEDANYSRREFAYASFSRSFTLPENIVPDKVTAQYENGILKLSLPKKEITISKPKKEITVD